MAFNPNQLVKLQPSTLFTQFAAIPSVIPPKTTVSIWTYQAENDTSTMVEAPGYFVYFADWKNNLLYENGQFFNIGDLIYCVCSDTTVLLVVDSLGPPIITSIYISGSPPTGFKWNTITSNTLMQPNNGYIVKGVGAITLTLPTIAAEETEIKICGFNSSGWTCVQNSGQKINFGNQSSSTGVLGGIASTLRYDSVGLICTVSDTEFNVLDSIGNITIN